MDYIKNKIVWVTGGTKGIGAALSQVLLEQGAVVIASSTKPLSYYINNNYFDSQFAQNHNFYYYQCDVSDKTQVQQIYNRIYEKFNSVDILINNAGVGLFKAFVDTTSEEVERLFKVNINGPIYCVQSALPHMLEKQEGTIVNISSVSAFENFANCSIYNMSKSALLSLGRSLRNEYRKVGIRVIDVLPGATCTDIWDAQSQIDFKDKLMQAHDVAMTIVKNIDSSLQGNLLVEEIVIRPLQGNI